MFLSTNNKTMLQKWYLLFMGQCSGVTKNFIGGAGIISTFFLSVVFFSRAN